MFLMMGVVPEAATAAAKDSVVRWATWADIDSAVEEEKEGEEERGGGGDPAEADQPGRAGFRFSGAAGGGIGGAVGHVSGGGTSR